MGIKVLNYINVQERTLILGCNQPTGIAILPKNFATANSKNELVHQRTTSTIRVLWRQVGVTETRIEKKGDVFPEIQEKSLDWIGPIIFFGVSVMSQSPELTAIALGVISNYLTDLFKGNINRQNITLDIVVEKTKGRTYKRVHFEGSIQDLEKAKLAQLVQRIKEDR